MSKYKSAFIALIGRPNSGKSTLLNQLCGENLAIVTPLPQTTQRTMRGIYTTDEYQLVFVDTPGIHRGKHTLNKVMYEQSTAVFSDEGIDIICYLVDLSRSFGKEEDAIVRMVEGAHAKRCIVFNKSDLCEDVESVKKTFFARYPGLASLVSCTLSAQSENARQLFLSCIEPMVPFGPRYFPDDDLTDSNMRFIASEFIRKQIIENTYEEVPHAACVEILEYKESEGTHTISAAIHVESDGQKGILIGKSGKVINRIRKQAEAALKKLTGENVTITCHVKISPKWRDNKLFLTRMGLNIPAEK